MSKKYRWVHICAWCGKGLGEKWYDTPQREPSHGICSDCERKHIQPHIDELKRKKGKK